MKTLSQYRALAAATVGATVSPFADVVLSSQWSRTLWEVVFLFPPNYRKQALSFARSAGRAKVYLSPSSLPASEQWTNISVELTPPALPVWPASLVKIQKRVRLTRIEGAWKFAEEQIIPARHQRQEHAQNEWRAWRKGYSSGLSGAGHAA